ncbi:MAG: sucrose phosphorylase, partial [Betaproteobacteria bacterium]
LNSTYLSALGGHEERYFAARAIQLFAKGVPQVYYAGLLAGLNDPEAVARTGEGRAVNRHNYTNLEIEAALGRPIVGRLLELIRLRNTHPAFDGLLRVDTDGGSWLRMSWQGESATCRLDVDLASGATSITEGSEMPLVVET